MLTLAPKMMRTIKAGVAYFALAFGAGFVLGSIRVPFLVPRLGAGFLALGLLLVAEILLVVALQGWALGQYVASRDAISGSVYLAMLALFAFMPLIIARTPSARVPSSR